MIQLSTIQKEMKVYVRNRVQFFAFFCSYRKYLPLLFFENLKMVNIFYIFFQMNDFMSIFSL